MQTGHACLEAGWQFEQPTAPCHLVILSVPSEKHLHDAVTWVRLNGIRCAVFYEPDDNLGDTAACTEPLPGNFRRVFKRYPLWSVTASNEPRGPPTPE